MEKDVFQMLKDGDPVDMTQPYYRAAIEHLNFGTQMSHKINHAFPTMENLRPLYEEMFEGRIPKTVNIMTPIQIDFPRQVTFGENVFINHSLTLMAAGGITIDEGCEIGPQVTIVTTNHDFDDHVVLKCKSVHLCKDVWIGARALILPGVTVGENSIIAGGAVVTKDVPPNTVVGGNPARVLKELPPPKPGQSKKTLWEAASKL